jgi:hypothetical protein
MSSRLGSLLLVAKAMYIVVFITWAPGGGTFVLLTQL